MRPRKKVLLLLENEHELGRWRFLLETRGYRVLSASSLAGATKLLHAHPDCRAALTNIPGDHGVNALSRALSGHLCFLLLFGVRFVPADTRADVVQMLEVPGGAGLAERVLDDLKRFTRLKRGPKPKQVPLTTAQLERQLRIERDGVPEVVLQELTAESPPRRSAAA